MLRFCRDIWMTWNMSFFMVKIYFSCRGGKVAETLQKQQLDAKDSRIKLMNEVLAGMKVLKLYAWEIPFAGRIAAIRDVEVVILRSCAKLWALVSYNIHN